MRIPMLSNLQGTVSGWLNSIHLQLRKKFLFDIVQAEVCLPTAVVRTAHAANALQHQLHKLPAHATVACYRSNLGQHVLQLIMRTAAGIRFVRCMYAIYMQGCCMRVC